jgi:hypothetical protein
MVKLTLTIALTLLATSAHAGDPGKCPVSGYFGPAAFGPC